MLQTLKTYLRYTSWPIIAAMVALIVFGVLAIAVAERADAAAQVQGPHKAVTEGLAGKQVQFALVALAAFLLATIVPYQRIGRTAYVLFAATLVLLVVVFKLPAVRDAHRWIDLGLVQFQPSEVAKIALIILLAWYLRYGDHYRRLRGLIVPFVLTLAPMGLILMEPDLGTSLLFLPTLYFMLYMAGAKLRHLLGIVALGTAMVLLPVPWKVQARAHQSPEDQRKSMAELADRKALAYWTFNRDGQEYAVSALPLVKIQPYQLGRIAGWLRQSDPAVIKDKGYQLHQSVRILGSGRLTGRGDFEVAGEYFQMLPDDHTDFIFSVVGGQWGFFGCLTVLLLYVVIFVFGVEIAVITYDPFGRLLAVGVLALLFTQIVINTGMTMGLMPVTGMTLPLVSYGGSSLVVNCFALGLLVNVGQRRPILLGQRPFEYGAKRQKPPRVAQPQAIRQ